MKTLYHRQLQTQIEAAFFKGRVIVLYGARTTGKTSLLQEIKHNFSGKALFLDCGQGTICKELTSASKEDLQEKIADNSLLILDDAHKVENIGLVLKLLGEQFPRVQVIAAGSLMLFDLANDRSLSLVGGKTRFYLYPLSIHELPPVGPGLEHSLIYGMSPAVAAQPEPQKKLAEMVNEDLYQAALVRSPVRNSQKLFELLQVLALHIGREFSFNDLGDELGIDKVTAARYVHLFEDAGIIFHISPFKRNLKEELSKLRKFYFYDLGIRNQLISNFNPPRLRPDMEQIWENFFICERLKYNRLRGSFAGTFFWRTYSGVSLDYLEEEEGRLMVFDCAWEKQRLHKPLAFTRAYPESSFYLINKKTFLQFL